MVIHLSSGWIRSDILHYNLIQNIIRRIEVNGNKFTYLIFKVTSKLILVTIEYLSYTVREDLYLRLGGFWHWGRRLRTNPEKDIYRLYQESSQTLKVQLNSRREAFQQLLNKCKTSVQVFFRHTAGFANKLIIISILWNFFLFQIMQCGGYW